MAHMCSKFVVFRDFTSRIREDLKESTKKRADILNRIMQKWSFLLHLMEFHRESLGACIMLGDPLLVGSRRRCFTIINHFVGGAPLVELQIQNHSQLSH